MNSKHLDNIAILKRRKVQVESQPIIFLNDNSSEKLTEGETSSTQDPLLLSSNPNSNVDNLSNANVLQTAAQTSRNYKLGGKDSIFASTCHVCPKIFASPAQLKKHARRFHQNDNIRISIPDGLKYMQGRLQIPSPTPGCDWKCPICPISFSTRENVAKHMLDIHSYKCPDCYMIFYSLFEISIHTCTAVGKHNQGVNLRIRSSKRCTPEKLELADRVSQRTASIPVSTSIYKPNEKTGSHGTNLVFNTIPTKAFQIRTKSVRISSNNHSTSDPLIERFKPITVSSMGRYIPNNAISLTKPEPVSLNSNTIKLNLRNYDQDITAGKFDADKVVTDPSENVFLKLKGLNDLVPFKVVRVVDQITNNKNNQNTPNNQAIDRDSSNHDILEEKFDNEYVRDKSTEDASGVDGDMTKENEYKNMSYNDTLEIQYNPSISIHRLPKDEMTLDEDHFSCARCGVLCADQQDFAFHLQECLSETAVCMEPTNNIGNTMKLKYETTLNDIYCDKSQGLSKPLLKALNKLRHISGIETLLVNISEKERTQQVQQKKYLSNSELQKLGIRSQTDLLKLKQLDEISVSKSPVKKKCKVRATTSATPNDIVSSVVVIPVPNFNIPESIYMNNKYDDDAPQISITDKKKCITWNFKPTQKPLHGTTDTIEISKFENQDKELAESYKEMTHSGSSSPLPSEESSCQFFNEDANEHITEPSELENHSPSDILLDEDDIKMEIEDVVIGDF